MKELPRLASLGDQKPPATVLQLIPKQICKESALVPVDLFGDVSTVAVSGPADLAALKGVAVDQIEPVLAEAEEIRRVINLWYS